MSAVAVPSFIWGEELILRPLDRKQIIINEIRYWKQHRMLPATYCDYLLSLYTEGEQDVPRYKRFQNWFVKIVPVASAAIILIGYLVIYFTEMSFDLQIVLGTFYLVATIMMARFYHAKHLAGSHFSFFVVALALLLFSMQLAIHLFQTQMAMLLMIGANGLLWLLIGKRWRIRFFGIAGYAVLLILLVYKLLE